MRWKIGDKVVVKPRDQLRGLHIVTPMYAFCGTVQTIYSVPAETQIYLLRLDSADNPEWHNGHWIWKENDFEPLNEYNGGK